MNKDTLICCIEFYQFSTDRMRLRSRNAHRRREKKCICRCPRAHFSNTYGAKRGFLGRGRRYMHGPSGEGECTVGTEGRVYLGDRRDTRSSKHGCNRRPSGSVAGFRGYRPCRRPLSGTEIIDFSLKIIDLGGGGGEV